MISTCLIKSNRYKNRSWESEKNKYLTLKIPYFLLYDRLLILFVVFRYYKSFKHITNEKCTFLQFTFCIILAVLSAGSIYVLRSYFLYVSHNLISLLLILAETLALLGSARRQQHHFVICAIFTCYLAYYEAIAKKVDLARPRARPQNRFSTSFLNSAQFLPVIWHSTTISLLPKEVDLARRGRAVCAK